MSILEELEKGILTSSQEETEEKASAFAKAIPEDTVLALHGDLGSGKTAFVKGLAKGWGIKERITSPSFNLFTPYKGKCNLLHLDAYRLENAHDVDSLLLEEFLTPPYCLVIEWAEKVGGFIPEDAWHLYFSIEKDHRHRIQLKKPIEETE
jgi:tRNA threonylcarbamoyladenosine biosynthesis protein TsaE